MLPLDLTITDYSTNEKIAYLPRKLTEEGSGPFGDVNGGAIPGQRGGVKAGHWRWMGAT